MPKHGDTELLAIMAQVLDEAGLSKSATALRAGGELSSWQQGLALIAMRRAYEAGRDEGFKIWLGKLADEFMSAYGYTARQANDYVTGNPEAWREYFNDDYTPAQAAHEDAIAGAS